MTLPFVGRRRQTARLEAELAAGRNVIVAGPYGIGRTALVNNLRREMSPDWRFVFLDGAQSPGRLCADLLGALFPRSSGRARRSPNCSSVRRRITILPAEDPRRHVLVLDDVAHLSAPKFELLRSLVRANHFRIVTIVETFLPPAELTRLRSVLVAGAPMHLGPLSIRACQRFFAEAADARGLPLSVAEIHGLAMASRGFPRGMNDLLAHELARHQNAPCHVRRGHSQHSRKEATP